MLTFPGAPPDIDCTWVHYSFSTTFGSRRVRTSVCVSLVVDDTTCTRVPFLCVPFVQIRVCVFSLFRRICLSLSHPSLFLRVSPSSSTLLPIRPSFFLFVYIRFVPSRLRFPRFLFLLYLSSPSYPSVSFLRPPLCSSTPRRVFPSPFFVFFRLSSSPLTLSLSLSLLLPGILFVSLICHLLQSRARRLHSRGPLFHSLLSFSLAIRVSPSSTSASLSLIHRRSRAPNRFAELRDAQELALAHSG